MHCHRLLRERGVTHVYICGVALDVCVAYTAHDCLEEGFGTSVVVDACRGVDEVEMATVRNELSALGVQFITAHHAITCLAADERETKLASLVA
jgi:nicotinamidase/pyrazinamidase